MRVGVHPPLSRGGGRRRARAVLLATLLAGCWALAAGPVDAATAFSFTTTPSLQPAFATTTSDYVTRCTTGTPVRVSVTGSSTTRTSVDGGPAKKGSFSANANVSPGQEFTVVTSESPYKTSTTYYVRCLPGDFPQFSATRNGTPQAQWYVLGLGLTFNRATTPPHYVAIFDNNGVPVWWYSGQPATMDAKLLPDGNVAWTYFTGGGSYQERRFDGSLVRTYSTVGLPLDPHELQILPNGNYLVISYTPRPGTTDLSAYGGPSTGATVVDCVVQEVTPGGSVVWSWNTADHISLNEVGSVWWPSIRNTGQPVGDGRTAYDVFHMNSVGSLGGSRVQVSMRHTDAVYRIDKPTGNIVWKLGGTPRPESLTVNNDPVFASGSTISGQHDARLLPDGSLTLYDNGTNRNRPPRAVRYAINPYDKTATLLESISDPGASTSLCCGSARRLSGGDWVISWGGDPLITEQTSSGNRVFALSLDPSVFSYRADPVLPGVVSASALRAGMNAQFPR